MFVFKKLHDLHDHHYVLTTNRNEERQDVITRKLTGWNLEFFIGVDKLDYSIEQFESNGTYSEANARKNDRRNKPMSLGNICCSLGHRMIYEEFLRSDYERVMVFEDDAYPINETEKILDQSIDSIPNDADLIYWGWQGNERTPFFAPLKKGLYHVQHALGLERYNHAMIKNLYPRPLNKYFSYAGKHFCAHAYTLSRAGAEKLIKWQSPVTYNADNAIMYAILNGDLRAYITNTKFFGQSSIDRTVEPLTA